MRVILWFRSVYLCGAEDVCTQRACRYGGDRAQQLQHMSRLGFTFEVLPDTFALHLGEGDQSAAWGLENVCRNR